MENNPQELDIGRYLQIIYKKRYLSIAAAAGIIAFFIVVSYFRQPSYEVSSTVSIEKNYLNVLMQDIGVAWSIAEGGQALSSVMMSRGMLLKVMSELKVDLETMSEAEIERLVKHYQRTTKIKVEMNVSGKRDMEIFTVSYQDSDPRFARDYVNTLIKQYIVDSLSSKRQGAAGANRFIVEQMNFYKDKIDRIEAELAQMPKQQGIEPLPEHLSALQKRYSELLVQYTEQHPEVVRLRAEIASTREQMQMSLRSRKDDESGQGSAVGDANAKKTRMANDGKRKSIADLQHDREAYKKIYESLVASIGRSEVSAQVEEKAKADTFRILDPAVLPIVPAGAPRWKFMLLGIVAGIAGGAGIAIVLDMTDKTIKNIDILKKFGLPVIGMIPHIQSAAAIVATRRMDRLVYSAAALYLAVVMALAVVEFLK